MCTSLLRYNYFHINVNQADCIKPFLPIFRSIRLETSSLLRWDARNKTILDLSLRCLLRVKWHRYFKPKKILLNKFTTLQSVNIFHIKFLFVVVNFSIKLRLLFQRSWKFPITIFSIFKLKIALNFHSVTNVKQYLLKFVSGLFFKKQPDMGFEVIFSRFTTKIVLSKGFGLVLELYPWQQIGFDCSILSFSFLISASYFLIWNNNFSEVLIKPIFRSTSFLNWFWSFSVR